jgi:hypothetical protein
LEADDGWTEEGTKAADIRLMCTHCYQRARARNLRPPSGVRGRAARLTAAEQSQLRQTACRQGQQTQDDAQERWRMGDFGRWDFSVEERTLTFSDPALGKLVADVRLVGSYSTKSNTFQWSWVLYSDDDPMIAGVADLRGFGEVRGLTQLTTNYFPCEQSEAWELTTLAGYLLGCQGYYRAPFDDGLHWFMLLSGFRHSQAN